MERLPSRDITNMDEQLQELAIYIQQTLPQSKSITHLQKDAKMGVVTFVWNSHKFIVKPSLEVLELRVDRLFITGASMLMQSALQKRDRDSKVFTQIDESLGQVEQLFNSHETEKGLSLLTTVKKTMEKFSPPAKRAKGTAK